METKKEIGDRQGVGYTLIKIGSIRRQKGELETAIEILREAAAITEEVNARDEIKEAYLELSETYATMDRNHEALAAFKQYERVKSDIFNERNSKNIAEMEARFESDRKEKEIEILKQQRAIDASEDRRQAATRRALFVGAIFVRPRRSATFCFTLDPVAMAETARAPNEPILVEKSA